MAPKPSFTCPPPPSMTHDELLHEALHVGRTARLNAGSAWDVARRTSRRLNRTQWFLGLLTLILGGLIYVVARLCQTIVP